MSTAKKREKQRDSAITLMEFICYDSFNYSVKKHLSTLRIKTETLKTDGSSKARPCLVNDLRAEMISFDKEFIFTCIYF